MRKVHLFTFYTISVPRQINQRHFHTFKTRATLNTSANSNKPTDKSKPEQMSSKNSYGSGGCGNTTCNVERYKEMIDMMCNERRLKEAVHVLFLMEERGFGVDSYTYDRVLRDCIDEKALVEVRRLYSHMNKIGFQPGIFIGNRLIDFYTKAGNVVDARQVFDKMPTRDVSSWNAMITGYMKCGDVHNARQIFDNMPKRDVISWNAMITGFAKCGNIEEARQLFDIMPERDVFSWNSMISACSQHGHGLQALDLFCQMQWAGMELSNYTFASALSACAGEGALEQGKWLHALTFITGFGSNVFVASALVDMYAKCGSVENASQVFNKMAERDSVSWNAMITGYACHGHSEQALKLFQKLKQAGMKPSEFTFASLLSACASPPALERGKQVHAHITRAGLESNVFVQSALVDMYANCGKIEHARRVFNNMAERDEVSWNGMITGFARHGKGKDALQLFWQMQAAGTNPNEFTFASVLSACAALPALENGKMVHAQIIKTGFESNIFVGNGLTYMYAKNGSVEDARSVFDRISQRDRVSWNAIIGGYAQHGHGEESLKLFSQMQLVDSKPDEFSFASVLRACACLASLEHGKQLHGRIVRIGFESNVYAGSALVDMYGKCGSLDNAWQVFNGMPERDLVSWTAMISGYAQNGHAKDALQLFERMLLAGMRPDHITFIGVLSACSHAGLVDEGCYYFDSMSQDHHLTPRGDHFACMIDLLGRAGRLDEARDLIDNMPFEPDATVWSALLGACKIHGNIELGKCAADCLFKLDPQNAATYVLLSNIYAAAGKWDDVAHVRKMMKDLGVQKKPGCSWIEVKNEVHSFVVEDRSHPQMEEIYAVLKELAWQMKEAGYVADTNDVE